MMCIRLDDTKQHLLYLGSDGCWTRFPALASDELTSNDVAVLQERWMDCRAHDKERVRYHPECLPHEVFWANVPSQNVAKVGWQTARTGKQAYLANGTKYDDSMYVPVFVNAVEMFTVSNELCTVGY